MVGLGNRLVYYACRAMLIMSISYYPSKLAKKYDAWLAFDK